MIWFINHILGGNGGEAASLWGGIIGDLSLFGAIYVMYRKHNCHQRYCWRISHRQIGNTGVFVCRKHHPEKAPTANHILALHLQHKANEKRDNERINPS